MKVPLRVVPRRGRVEVFPYQFDRAVNAMDVILKVLKGSKAGAKIAVKKDEFLIGRSPNCNLCVGSTSISRKHCLIKRSGSEVTIQDLGSRNGTLINGKKISEETALSSGDEITIGTLHFMVTISHGISNQKKPQVKSVAGAVQRSADSSSGSTIIKEEDITKWLLETESPSETISETQTIRMDDTKAGQAAPQEVPKPSNSIAKPEKSEQPDTDTPTDESAEETATAQDESATAKAEDSKGGGKKKKKAGKLPEVPKKNAAKDSREAAMEALRAWNRRH